MQSQRWDELQLSTGDPEGAAWLERQGVREADRAPRIVLELADLDPLPRGSELTDYAARPELAPKLHALMLEGLDDIEGALAEDRPTLETWLGWQRAPSRRPDFIVIALDAGEPVGYAQLHVYPRVGWHGFTVVARSHRRRGFARELKLELIRRAKARGIERLVTMSNVDNMPMRSLNAELGYRPVSDLVVYRGPTPAA